MQPVTSQWVTTSAGALFILFGVFGLILQAHLDAAVWLILGGELIVLGSADQRRQFAPWRVVASWLLPLVGVTLIVLHLAGWLR